MKLIRAILMLMISAAMTACVIADSDCASDDGSCNALIAAAVATSFTTTMTTTLPTPPVTGPALWYRAESSDADLVGNTVIFGLADLSGNSDPGVAVGDQVPSSTTTNDQPSLTLDGTNDYLETSLTFSSAATIFLVANPSTSLEAYWLGSSGSGGSPAIISQYLGRSLEWFHTNGGSDRITIADSTTGLQIMTVQHEDAAALGVYLNGTLVTPVAVPTSTMSGTNLNFLGTANPGVGYAGGEFSELLIYNSFLSEADRITVECYLSARYSISVSNAC